MARVGPSGSQARLLHLISSPPPAMSLVAAVHSRQFEAVRRCLDEGASANKLDGYGHSVLMIAAMEGSVEIMRLLILRGANVNACVESSSSGQTAMYGTTALHFAVENKQQEAAMLLIQNGADCNRRQACYGLTPLMIAARLGHHELVRVLITAGANVHHKDKLGRSALTHALQAKGENASSHALRAAGAQMDD